MIKEQPEKGRGCGKKLEATNPAKKITLNLNSCEEFSQRRQKYISYKLNSILGSESEVLFTVLFDQTIFKSLTQYFRLR